MELKKIEYKLTVCKVADVCDIDMAADFTLSGKRMKKCRWCAGQRTHLQNGRTG